MENSVELKRQAWVWRKSPEGSISVAANAAPRRSRGNFSPKKKKSVLKPLTSRAACVSGCILSTALKHHSYDWKVPDFIATRLERCKGFMNHVQHSLFFSPSHSEMTEQCFIYLFFSAGDSLRLTYCSDQEPGDGTLHPQRERRGGEVQELHWPGGGVALHHRRRRGDGAHRRAAARPCGGAGNYTSSSSIRAWMQIHQRGGRNILIGAHKSAWSSLICFLSLSTNP